jgi:hypothetical protein
MCTPSAAIIIFSALPVANVPAVQSRIAVCIGVSSDCNVAVSCTTLLKLLLLNHLPQLELNK